jgi:glycerophosphoryl diester phosphodiesterase
VAAANCGVWSPYYRDVTRKALAEAHALRLKVIPWTVNERADMADKGMPLPPQVQAR